MPITRNTVSTKTEALLYITDCLLATVEALNERKSKSKSDFERHIGIAQTSVHFIISLKIIPEKGSRLEEVIQKGGVINWIKQ